jgi:hypothetical protein
MRQTRTLDEVDPPVVPGERSSRPSGRPVMPSEYDIFRYFRHEPSDDVLRRAEDGDETLVENFRP